MRWGQRTQVDHVFHQPDSRPHHLPAGSSGPISKMVWKEPRQQQGPHTSFLPGLGPPGGVLPRVS